MSEYTAPSGQPGDGPPSLSPAEQFEAWVASRADGSPAFAAPLPAAHSAPPTAPLTAPPTASPSAVFSSAAGVGPSAGWPLPAAPDPDHRRRRAGLAVATAAAVALGSFGFAAGIAYHRAQSAGAVPASTAGPNFGIQGGSVYDPFGSGTSGSSGSSAGPLGGFGNGFGSGSGSADGSSSSADGSSGSTGSASAPTGEAASKVAAAVDPGIVDINTQIDYGSAAGAGTGMVLSSDGLILTNNHVVDGATDI